MILSRQLLTLAPRAIALSIVASFVLCSGSTVYSGETRNLEALFLRATTEAGDAYLATRKEILSTKTGVGEFLEGKRKSGKTADERWLAEILLARLNQPDAFTALEQEFHAKVNLYYRAYPDFTQSSTSHPRHWRGLLTAEDPLPGEQKPGTKKLPPHSDLKSVWGIAAPRVRTYFESLRVGNSPLWSPLCGEIIMKGWVPDKPVSAAVPQVPFPTSRSSVLVNRDYMSQAFELLGKYGERRAGPHALRILQDVRQDDSLRATAAMCLGRLKYSESLPELLVLCESTQVPRHLHYVICFAVIEIDDPNMETQLRKVVIKLTAKGLKTKVVSTPPQMSMGDVLVSHYVDDVERALQTLAERKSLK